MNGVVTNDQFAVAENGGFCSAGVIVFTLHLQKHT
jgi:hypothetical protein